MIALSLIILFLAGLTLGYAIGVFHCVQNEINRSKKQSNMISMINEEMKKFNESENKKLDKLIETHMEALKIKKEGGNGKFRY